MGRPRPAGTDLGPLPVVKIARPSEEPKQPHNDQINRDDVVQQSRDNQDENARDQRDQRADAEGHVHGGVHFS